MNLWDLVEWQNHKAATTPLGVLQMAEENSLPDGVEDFLLSEHDTMMRYLSYLESDELRSQLSNPSAFARKPTFSPAMPDEMVTPGTHRQALVSLAALEEFLLQEGVHLPLSSIEVNQLTAMSGYALDQFSLDGDYKSMLRLLRVVCSLIPLRNEPAVFSSWRVESLRESLDSGIDPNLPFAFIGGSLLSYTTMGKDPIVEHVCAIMGKPVIEFSRHLIAVLAQRGISCDAAYGFAEDYAELTTSQQEVVLSVLLEDPTVNTVDVMRAIL